MIAVALGATRAEQAARVVRALGAHRYVAGRLHLLHAMALAALPAAACAAGGLTEARAWALDVLGDPGVDPASRDERLWRRSSDAEVAAVLGAYWMPGEIALEARAALCQLLERHGLTPPGHAPFDESVEEDLHPLLIDAGWELLPLAELHPERHRGAIAAFGEPIAFESARFEEETAVPPRTHLYELPAMGPVELLQASDEAGELAEPLVVWAQGDETYLDYVLRGVRRAAKLPERPLPLEEDDGDEAGGA